MSSRRMVLVHAHPDDETISTGATMAHYAAAGVGVTLVTCTLGEEGEILVPAYAQLEAAQADQLGGLRIGELAAAMRALGVEDHRFLGGAGRFRDSGMLGTPPNEHPRAFWRAATDVAVFEAAVTALVEVLREVRPQVVVTYDENGDYGHPDHVVAHRVTMAAVRAAADAGYGAGDPWPVPKVYWTATPRSVLESAGAAMRARPALGFSAAAEQADHGVDDAVITTVVDAAPAVPAKREALRAHATQVVVRDGFYALSNLVGRVVSGVEHFRLVQGEASGPFDAQGHEQDLFAGIPA